MVFSNKTSESGSTASATFSDRYRDPKHPRPRALPSLLFACFLALLSMVSMSGARASMHMVKPGHVPTLAADEGLVVIDVDTSESISALSIRRDNKYFGGEMFTDIPRGKSSYLYVVTAGTYRWDSIDYYFGRFRFNLVDDPEFHFEVKPGVVNYPGDLVFRPDRTNRALIHATNRGLGAIDFLEAKHPEAYKKYGFSYTGHYGDPFPAFYRAEREAHAGKPLSERDKTVPPPAPGTLPIAVEDLWRYQRIQQFNLSPDGDFLAEAIYLKGKWYIDLIDLKANEAIHLFDSDNRVERLTWAGKRVLAVALASSTDPTVFVSRIGDGGPKGHTFNTFKLPRNGWIIDALADDPAHVVFESTDGDGATVVHRLDITDEGSLREQLKSSHRIDRGVDHAVSWLTDAQGRLRMALAKRDNGYVLFHGSDGKFAEVLTLDDKTAFNPLALSADGNLIYGLSDKDRQQRDLVAFDPSSKTIATVYSKPGFDIDEPVFGEHRRLIGAMYYRNGVPIVEYFDKDDQRIANKIAEAFPGYAANVVDRNDAGTRFLVTVEKSDQPYKLYELDLATSEASPLDESAPWLDDKHLAPARIVHAKGSDGLPIEAYLTMPLGVSGKPPLVVYSHGGPIGIRDSLEFDPAVQLFASLGYAVLQVNFRGSDGYGTAFRDAGRHHYGSLIEDDIDAATRAVLAEFPIDGDRMCVVGASYGGYSAMVSAIRWPTRFRCAVSIAGVSDQMLMFTASDSARSALGRKALEKAIGVPANDEQSMRAYSPVYRYQELATPVLLAHGTEDVRVDYEHTRRMIRMLNMAGRTPTALTFEGEGHGGFSADNEAALWRGVAGFLRAHLDTPSAK